MTRRTAIKILRRAGDNLAGANWPHETYCPPWGLVIRAARRLRGDSECGDVAGAWLAWAGEGAR